MKNQGTELCDALEDKPLALLLLWCLVIIFTCSTHSAQGGRVKEDGG